MAGRAVASGLTEPVAYRDPTFSVASRAEEPELRRLLRENPLGGRFEITLEREPDAFAGDFGLAISQVFVIAYDGKTREAVGVCERTVRDAYVDGEVRALPYLGALRVAPSHRRRIGVLRGGFEALRALAEGPGELPFALTSITSDNEIARRLLTAGVPGLPIYRPVGDFSTFALRPRRMRIAPDIAAATEADLPALAAFLQRSNAKFQFSSVWTKASLERLAALGLRPEHFLLARTQGRIRGCLALWDQRSVRQAVIRRYPALIGRMRPLINLAAPFVGLPKLPAPGAPFNQAAFSHLALDDDDTETFLALVAAGLDRARRRGFDAATIGFASSRPLREALMRRHRAIEYRTTLYLVHWAEAAARVAALRPVTPHPELGLL